MSKEKILFIVNPASASGATGREWPSIRNRAERLLGPCQVVMTMKRWDAAIHARAGITSGAGMIICLGGDGTLHEVVI
ncbi:MAG: diacylglycerol kinase family protein [Syntrophales bacterium]|nr:diacylglycerol kinase family protein [Syntrophales bacterium]MDD5233756.1 diacylglycerol kinase family protein [Syntrophales bacterium]